MSGYLPAPEGEHPAQPPAVQLRALLDSLRRRWWLVVAAMVVSTAAAWYLQRNQVPVYTSEVLLQKTLQTPEWGGSSDGEPADFGAQMEILRSTTVLETVVDSLGLQLSTLEETGGRHFFFEEIEVEPAPRSGPYVVGMDDGEVVLRDENSILDRSRVPGWLLGPGFRFLISDTSRLAEPIPFRLGNRQRAVERLRRRVVIEPGGGIGFVRIRFTDEDPELAAAVANQVGLSYVATRTQTAREAAARRREIVAAQLDELADSVRRAQAAVAEYQASTRLINPTSEGNSIASELMNVESDLRGLRFQRGLLNSVVTALRSGDPDNDGLHRVVGISDDLFPGGARLYQRLQELNDQRSRLTGSRFGFTESNPEVEVTDSLISATKAQIGLLAGESLNLLRQRIAAAEARAADLRSEMSTIPGQTAELTRLQQRLSAVQSVFDALSTQYYSAQIEEGVVTGDVRLVDRAPIPLDPDPSTGTLGLMVALLIGTILGVGAVFTAEYVSAAVTQPEEAQRIANLPVLGVIPRLPKQTAQKGNLLEGMEAFRTLRTNLYCAPGAGLRVLAVTSPAPREGKSLVTANLAMALEQQGLRVLLIDADLRRPALHTVFGVEPGLGLSDLLAGDARLERVALELRPHLSLITCGSPVTHAPELLGGDSLPRVLLQARDYFEVVVIDTPPVLAVSDAVLVSHAADAVLVVVRANQTDREALSRTMHQLRQVDAPVLGLVVNDAASHSTGRYGYYGNAYHEQAKAVSV